MSRRNTWLIGAMSAATVAAVVAAPAQAAVPLLPIHSAATPVDCPAALPTARAVDGLTGTGYTVERGTTPEPFSARVLGRVNDGIAPGVDLIMAELDSPALRRAGGVWGGMSGSPVYTTDGRLIGSVSYGLAASSPIAGITPAAALGTLLNGDPDGFAARRARRTAPVRPGASAARRLAATGEVSLAEATGGFHRLQVPVLVSGASSPRAQTFLSRLQAKSGVPVMAGGSSAPATSSTPARPLAGGDGFAATVAYGDVTMGGVGTATYTCRGRAVAFGHPFLSYGMTSMAAHSASAVYVQPDPVLGPFKVANIGAVIGTVDRDRTLGLRAVLGTAPRPTTITSTLTRVESGAARTGTTRVVEPGFAPDAAAFHAMFNVDRVLGSTASVGTARLSMTVRGRRANGAAFSLTVGDTFTDTDHQNPIDVQAGTWAYDTLNELVGQKLERVTLTSVKLGGTISSRAAVLQGPVVQVLSGKAWVSPRSGVRAVAGRPVRGRILLTSLHSSTKTTVPTSITASSSLRGQSLWYSVEAGYGMSDQAALTAPTSFPALLKEVASQPRSDEVRVSILRADGRLVLRTRYRTTQSVSDAGMDWALRVR